MDFEHTRYFDSIHDYVCSLEQRYIFDAAAAAAGVDVAVDMAAQSEAAMQIGQMMQGNTLALASVSEQAERLAIATAVENAELGKTVVFIDAHLGATEIATLKSGLASDAEIYLIDSESDALMQMAAVLNGYQDVGSVHIVSHGSAGELHIGNSVIDASDLTAVQQAALQNIGISLADGADLLIYGCDFGAGEIGKAAVETLASLTGADIAASDDATGAIRLGADWVLETTTGLIEAQLAFNSEVQENLSITLASLAITDNQPVMKTNSMLTYTFKFIEAVTGFDASDVRVTNGTKGAFSGSSDTYTLNVTPVNNFDGDLTVNVDAGAATAIATGSDSAAAQAVQGVDTAPPVLASISPLSTAGKSLVTVDVLPSITFNEAIGAVDMSKIVFRPIGTSGRADIGVASASISGKTVTLDPVGTQMPMGTYAVVTQAGAFKDIAGNALKEPLLNWQFSVHDTGGKVDPLMPDPTISAIEGDNVINMFEDDGVITLTGTAAAGSSITLINISTSSIVSNSIAVDPHGRWHYDYAIGRLSDGQTVHFSAVSKDVVGKTSPNAATGSITVNLSAPTALFAQPSLRDHYRPSDSVEVLSTEAGQLYLVSANVQVFALKDILSYPHAKSSVNTAFDQGGSNAHDAKVSINLAGLKDGHYRLYAVNAAGNVSRPAGDKAGFATVKVYTPRPVKVTPTTETRTDLALPDGALISPFGGLAERPIGEPVEMFTLGLIRKLRADLATEVSEKAREITRSTSSTQTVRDAVRSTQANIETQASPFQNESVIERLAQSDILNELIEKLFAEDFLELNEAELELLELPSAQGLITDAFSGQLSMLNRPNASLAKAAAV